MPRSHLLLVSTPLGGDTLPGGVCPSLANLTLASYVQAQGEAVAVLDPSVDLPAGALDAPAAILDHTVDAIVAQAPRVVGVSALSPVEGRFAAALARRLKARGVTTPVVVGGVWATAVARTLMDRCPEVDAVVVGPGEDAAVALARGGLDAADEVLGLLWRRDGALVHNPPAPRVPGTVPVDLSLMAHPERYDIFCWLTSRGCPFHCAFCTERLTSPRFSYDPLDKVRADVQAFKALDRPWYLWICDPLFDADRKRMGPLCAAIGEAGLSFLVESRVDVLHPDDIPALKAAGCNLIYFGLESLARKSLCELDKIDDRQSRYDRYVQGARDLVVACCKADIVPVMGVLNPVPGDTEAELVETLRLLTELRDLAVALGPEGHGVQPCFHAFPVRFDQGAPYEGQEARLRHLGVTFVDPPDRLFGDRFIADASPTLSAARADAFRAEVRALNPTNPAVLQRLWRSFPRPYVEFE